MKVPRTARAAPLALLLVVGGSSPTLAAELDASVSFEGVGDLEDNLPDRLGPSLNAVDHYINIEDCELYLGKQMTVTFNVGTTTNELAYALMYSETDATCQKSSVTPEQQDGCYIIDSDQDLDSSTVEMLVEFDELIGNDCDSGENGTAHLYMVVQDVVTTTNVDSKDVEITVDLDPPDAPEITQITSGDGRFTVEWDEVADESDVDYIVYYSTAPITDVEADGVDKEIVDGTSTSVDSGLENGTTYYVVVVTRDEAENESALSSSETIVPEQTEDFWERYQSAGGTDPGGFCFIATAAYGSSMTGDLDTLRAFRDEMLMPTEGGSAFVSSYYAHGRRWAAWIADKPVARAIVRVLLVPVVFVATVVLELGPYLSFVLLLAGVALFRHLRRRATRDPFLPLSVELRS